MEHENVIGAFSEEQAATISGLSVYQLREWNRRGFFHPAYDAGAKGVPFGRIYSFRDLVSLQVLDDLRNRKHVPLSHLRQVAARLAHLGESRWIATTLYVLGKRVVFDNPSTLQREEVVSGQRVLNIPLRVVARSTRERIHGLNDRSHKIGQFEQSRFVSSNRRVFNGTRVPLEGVLDYLKAGYGSEQIIREFPDLTEADVSAAQQESRAA